MKHSITTTLTAGVAIFLLASGAGCVSQHSVDEARATADRALQAAQDGAQASKACCDATNEKLDRMFKSSVGK